LISWRAVALALWKNIFMRFRALFFFAVLAFCLPAFQPLHAAVNRWLSIGPDGGDARSFAYDPTDVTHVYLGTTNGWIYQSMDAGAHWSRLSKIGASDEDLVVDHLIVDSADPHTLYAGVWRLDKFGGGVWVSHDSGLTWTELPGMDGQSVRALVQAPSNPNILVAGTISGVYRSEDGGAHWKEISPAGSGQIIEVQSVAVDPVNPDVIYAGTWHLPWKTSDGGKHWVNIRRGIITDSDIFSILIDPKAPQTLYMSACSGIFKTYNGGELFRKVQGIPTTARRTRAIKEDPLDRRIVYAGTTEGLYKTVNAGETWRRMTNPYIVINDIYIDPQNPERVLMATDHGGVLASNDGGKTFTTSNQGFSGREVTSILLDRKHPGRIYAGVVNGWQYGGVYVSADNGRTWQQQSEGLGRRDVFSLAEANDGTLLAGTDRGIFRWTPNGWVQDGNAITEHTRIVEYTRNGRLLQRTVVEDSRPERIEGRVGALLAAGNDWFASTPEGVYRSTDHGQMWRGPVLSGANYFYLGKDGPALLASNFQVVRRSLDGGRTWIPLNRPAGLTQITAVTVSPGGKIWVGGPQGVYWSGDNGHEWHAIRRLPTNQIRSLAWDPAKHRVVVTSRITSIVYAIDPDTLTWKWWDAGWRLHSLHSVNGRLLAASPTNGVILEPQQPANGSALAEIRSH
jgi:photosystem II stability/assembly factor-like uncharacterized protein